MLATVVAVEGSSYRRPGARLLLARDGSYAGAISGGCLEAEVMRKALWLVRNGACVQRYSTLFDDANEMPYGLGCGGTVHVLLEPADTPACEQLFRALEESLSGRTLRVQSELPAEGAAVHRVVQNLNDSEPVRNDGPARSTRVLFEETLEPPQRLLVFGAGDDAQPLTRLAALLGWTIIVVDGRPQWATRARFPEADDILPTREALAISIGERDAAVIMTHSYEQDRACLLELLPRRPRYLGLLGARHRSALLLGEVAAALGWQPERICDAVFAPVGLDLGGDGAECIALAILAEIQACIENRLPAPRHLTPDMLLAQANGGGPAGYVQTQCAL